MNLELLFISNSLFLLFFKIQIFRGDFEQGLQVDGFNSCGKKLFYFEHIF